MQEYNAKEIVTRSLALGSGTTIDPFLVVAQKTTADFTVDLCDGGTSSPGVPYGIVQPKTTCTQAESDLIIAGTRTDGAWNDADDIAVFRGRGECLAKIGTAGVTRGDALMVEASTGKVVTYSSGGNFVGIALESASAGELGRIEFMPQVGYPTLTVYYTKALDAVQILTGDGAITKPTGNRKLILLNKAGAIAYSLADPVIGDLGKTIYIRSLTAQAHIGTITGGLCGGTYNTATHAGAIDDGLVVIAMEVAGGTTYKWVLVSQQGITLSHV